MTGRAESHFEVIIFPLATLIVITIMLYTFSPKEYNKGYIDKEALHSKITLAAKNGASLEDIKQFYLGAKKEKNPTSSDWLENIIIPNMKKDIQGYYSGDVSLLDVLKNTKAELFLKEKIDIELIKIISEKIDEHSQSNPFDRLEQGQKIYFETIKTKLKENYDLIQDDINRVVDELDEKNQLTNKYLSDSTMSYNLSIYAFIIGILALLPLIKSFWEWIRDKIKGNIKNS